MRCFRLIFVTISLISIFGCNRPDPNPHFMDPIYKHLGERVSQTKSQLDTEIKALEEAEKTLAKTQPLTHERKVAERDVQSIRKRIEGLRQEFDYLSIRLERRLVEDKVNYRLAFEKGEAWPDPEEYKAYLTTLRLNQASKNWNERVPKLQDRILAAWPSGGAEAKKETGNSENQTKSGGEEE